MTHAERPSDASNTFHRGYQELGRELAENLARSDGTELAISLHGRLERDLCDWFYDRVWPYFSAISPDDWSEDESEMAEFNCRNVVSFFQSLIGAAAAKERGYIPAHKEVWLTDWLLRLNLGDSAAKQANESWSPAFRGRDREAQLQLLCSALSRFLPDTQGQFFLLRVYAPTLELRVQATTAEVLGDINEAHRLRDQAVAMDNKLDAAIQHYLTGGWSRSWVRASNWSRGSPCGPAGSRLRLPTGATACAAFANC